MSLSYIQFELDILVNLMCLDMNHQWSWLVYISSKIYTLTLVYWNGFIKVWWIVDIYIYIYIYKVMKELIILVG